MYIIIVKLNARYDVAHWIFSTRKEAQDFINSRHITIEQYEIKKVEFYK